MTIVLQYKILKINQELIMHKDIGYYINNNEYYFIIIYVKTNNII